MLDLTGRLEVDSAAMHDAPFRHLIEQSAQGILVECGSRFVYANEACARLLGFPDADALLRRSFPSDLFAHTPHVGRTVRTLAASIEPRDPVRLTVQSSRQDIAPVWLEILIQRVLWQGSTAIQYVMSDVTERRKSQERARRLQMQLLDNARTNAMREAANSIAHGLNQPRGAMLNYLNAARRMMRRGAATDQILEVLDRLTSEAERAYQVIAEVENLFDHHLEGAAPHDLRAILIEIVDAATVEASEQNVAVHTEIAPDLPPAAIIRTQIQHVVFTLLHDAIGAFDTERVREVAVRAWPAGRAFIRVEISDTAYVRLRGGAPNRERHRSAFALSQSIVEGHGGRIETLPRVPEGTIVTFDLPTELRVDTDD